MNLTDIFAKVLGLWESEPVAIVALITAALDVATVFGAPISPEQKTAVVGVVSALGVLVARNQVTPVAKA